MSLSRRNFLTQLAVSATYLTMVVPVEAKIRIIRPTPRPSPGASLRYPKLRVPVRPPRVPVPSARNLAKQVTQNPVSGKHVISQAHKARIATCVAALDEKRSKASSALRNALNLERSYLKKSAHAAKFKIQASDVHAHHIFEFEQTRKHPAIIAAARSGLWNHNGKVNGVALHKSHHARIHTQQNQQTVNEFLDKLEKTGWTDAQKAIVIRNAARDIRRAITRHDTLAQHLNYARRSFNYAS